MNRENIAIWPLKIANKLFSWALLRYVSFPRPCL